MVCKVWLGLIVETQHCRLSIRVMRAIGAPSGLLQLSLGAGDFVASAAA